jgi:apolipoprotein D and lipocalin family protein
MTGMKVSMPRWMSMLVPGAVTFCLVTLLMSGCAGIPDGVEAVKGFDVNRYLGTWYEIARLDHSFERGLSRVQAEYSLRDDGGISVTKPGSIAGTMCGRRPRGRRILWRAPMWAG